MDIELAGRLKDGINSIEANLGGWDTKQTQMLVVIRDLFIHCNNELVSRDIEIDTLNKILLNKNHVIESQIKDLGLQEEEIKTLKSSFFDRCKVIEMQLEDKRLLQEEIDKLKNRIKYLEDHCSDLILE